MDGKHRKLVVAIDFGTTYSGYAFSLYSDFKSNPTRVSTLKFKVGSMKMTKTPTCLLFTPDKEFHSFGADAEEKYAMLCNEGKQDARSWYFFKDFKLTLHKNKTLSRDLMLPDQTKKKKLPALDVFSAAIGYLKKHFTEKSRGQSIDVPDSEVTWVLTVPAIWDDGAKDFMREAAQKAGIPGQQLVLALEPEAASVFCLEHFESSRSLEPYNLSKPGKKFILVDCGGGTIDISAFKVQEGNRLQHLHRPEGTSHGGTRVDDAFKEFLLTLLGADGMASIDKLELLELMREFENTKRSQTPTQRIAIRIPGTITIAVEDAIATLGKETITKRLKLASKVENNFNVIYLDKDLSLSFFEKSAQSIPQSIQNVMDHEKVGSVDAIFLAGGFSESDVIQTAVKKAFPDDLVLVAPSPSASIMTGAVMYGHNTDVIATRVSAFTYGVDARSLFEDDVHDKARLVIGEDGKRRCEDCFSVHITIDQEVEVNTLLPYRTYTPITSDQTKTTFNIYRSTKEKPLYVDEEGSEKIGTVTVLMPDTAGGLKREIKAAMKVGGTELEFFAKDETSGEEFTTTCDFLSKN